MKKSGFIIIGFLITASVCAQNYDAGIKGGLNLSGLSGDMEDKSLKTTFHLGIFGQLLLSENYTLQPELIYSRQGSNLKDSDYSFSLQYLNIPVIGKFYVTDQVNFQIGPQIAFLLNSELKNGLDFDIDEWTKGTSLAVAVGIGYDYEIFTFDARYNIGLSNVFDNPEFSIPGGTVSIGEDVEVYNQVLQISVGVKLLDKILD